MNTANTANTANATNAANATSVRCGVDVADVTRISAVIDRRPAFLQRVFTRAERVDCVRGDLTLDHPVARQRIAARFAAKEAARKALGTDLRWGDVEVRTVDGAPTLWVRGVPSTAAISLSHDAGVAVAFVVVPDPASDPAPDVAPDASQRSEDHAARR